LDEYDVRNATIEKAQGKKEKRKRQKWKSKGAGIGKKPAEPAIVAGARKSG
jgi:hypothetical protein